MILFIDASAMVAIMTSEPGGLDLERGLGDARKTLCSAISLWETTRAIAGKRPVTTTAADTEVQTFVADFDLQMVPIGRDEASAAIDAHGRYGKGSGHPARLNMGECFAYACTKINGARLLYKGSDFFKTDLA